MRIEKNKLYVIESNHSTVYGEWYKEQSILNPKFIRDSYFPRHLLIGEFKPDSRIYRLENGRFPEYQLQVIGFKLKEVMDKLGIKTAFLVEKKRIIEIEK